MWLSMNETINLHFVPLVVVYAVQICLFLFLTGYNIYAYFYKRVRSLTLNRFHLLMFLLILVASVMAIVQGCIRIAWLDGIQHDNY